MPSVLTIGIFSNLYPDKKGVEKAFFSYTMGIEEKDAVIARTGAALKTNLLNEIDKKAESLMAELKENQKEIEAVKSKMAAAKANDIMSGIKHIGDINLIVAQLDNSTVDNLRKTGDAIKEKTPMCVCVFGANTDGKISFVAMAGADAVAKGVHCGKIIKEITAIAGGSGGGKPDSAQGGGKDASKIDDALARVDEIITSQIG